jgi:uncharacterized protein YbjT (DUF2867 family)
MKVLVTGASGFIGRPLVKRLVAQRHQVVATYFRGTPPACWRAYRWDLRQAHDPAMLSEVEVVIHAAHDLRAGEAELVQGLHQFHRAVQQRGIRQVFLSSLSASESSPSPYGRQKYELEKNLMAADPGISIVRPGLVIGPGGVFGRLKLTLQRWPLFPLIDRGSSLVSFIGLDDLLMALEQLVCGRVPPGEYNLFSDRRVPFAEMLKEMAQINGWRRVFLNVPSSLILMGIRLAEQLRLPLPVRRENVTGLRQNSNHPYQPNLVNFGLPERSFVECYRSNFPS